MWNLKSKHSFLLVAWHLFSMVPSIESLNGESRLVRDLFANYTVEARPVLNNNDVVRVDIGLALNDIISVKEKSESIVTFMFMRMLWNDPNLTWDPADYNNVKAINIQPHNIWIPDITLENNVESDHSFAGSLDTLKNRVILENNGNIKWLAPALLSSKCPMNIQYFPFDTQVCELVFLSWTYTGKQLDLYSDLGFSLASYTKNSEWEIENATFYMKKIFYECCADTPFPVVHFRLKLKRKPLFYLTNLILPIVVISMLCMLLFYLPAESGERVSFGVTIFLSMTIFMLIVDDLIPATSDAVPLVTIFFTAVISEMVCMLVVLCYILNLYLKTPEQGPMPKWMRKYVYEGLAFKLGTRKAPIDDQLRDEIHENQNAREQEREREGENEYFSGNRAAILNRKIKSMDAPSKNKSNHTKDIPHLNEFSKKMDWIVERFQREDDEKEQISEWRICALTFDRLAFIVFSLVFLLITLGCFLSPPGTIIE